LESPSKPLSFKQTNQALANLKKTHLNKKLHHLLQSKSFPHKNPNLSNRYHHPSKPKPPKNSFFKNPQNIPLKQIPRKPSKSIRKYVKKYNYKNN
jgi:hypothetical protein